MPAGNRGGTAGPEPNQTFFDHHYNHPGVADAKSVVYGSYPYSHQTSFHDITEGSNFTPDTACGYLCTAEPGYDGPTGLGTPNGIGGF